MTSRTSFLFFLHPTDPEPKFLFRHRSIFCWCIGISTQLPTILSNSLTLQLKQPSSDRMPSITWSIVLLLCVILAHISRRPSSITSSAQHTVHRSFIELNNCPARPTLANLKQHHEETTFPRSTEAIDNIHCPRRRWRINRSNQNFIEHVSLQYSSTQLQRD